MIWLTADHHFGHAAILGYCDRPYDTVEEMDRDLIARWNAVVSPNDVVYHLGDFTLGGLVSAQKYFGRLKGYIHVLPQRRHHDRRWIAQYDRLLLMEQEIPAQSASRHPIVLLDAIVTVKIPDVDRMPIVLSHFPLASWERSYHGSYHLFGHCHNTYKPHNRSLDVGIDSAYNILGEYRPLSAQEAVGYIKKQGYAYAGAKETLDR